MSLPKGRCKFPVLLEDETGWSPDYRALFCIKNLIYYNGHSRFGVRQVSWCAMSRVRFTIRPVSDVRFSDQLNRVHRLLLHTKDDRARRNLLRVLRDLLHHEIGI